MENITTQDIEAKIAMMEQIVSSFIAVITQENAALQFGDIVKVKSLYEQKVKTVAAYRSLSAFFIKNKEAVAAHTSSQKEQLKTLSAELDGLLKTNELLLKTRMEAGKAVMNTFVEAAKRANAKSATSYGAKGVYTPLDNNRNALAFNCTM
ncbi:MAG: hypothetical protein IJ184_02680 [Alphaproteobacteria bacterium]|nr:hypothetical protein [Alphaproteobacteria bacterium]